MDNVTQSIRNQRRPKGIVSPIATNYFHLRNPLVTAWWFAAFPGFGHIILGSYIKGFLLILWKIIVNTQSKINLAILYSFTGKFDQAKSIIDKRWIFLYIPLFIYAVWDSYRSTVDINKLSILADHEKSPIIPVKLDFMEINYLDKRNPWLSVMLTVFLPGTGHLYTHRLPTGFFVLVWWIAISYFSHLFEAVYFTAIGTFNQAIAIVDPEWILFMPSIVGFAIYDAYVNTVEYNKLFEINQSDGISLFDVAIIIATIFMLGGTIYGFVLKWGPILCGVIGFIIGALIGFAIDILPKKRNGSKNKVKDRTPEIFLLVECQKKQSETVEGILWDNLALGIAKIENPANQ